MHGHTDSKSILQYAFFLKYQFRDGRLQSVCQIFYSVIFIFVYTSIIFPEMQRALRLAIIYHAEKKNTRTEIQKYVIFCQKCRLAKA